MSEIPHVFVAATRGERWRARTAYANLVRFLVAVGPLSVGLAFSFVAARMLPPAPDTAGLVMRWVLMGGVAFLLVRVLDRAARRFLPLAALLDLSLSFPEGAPSRIRLALDRDSEEELAQRIHDVRANGLSPEPAEAAQQVLQLVSGLSRHDRITRGHAERVRGYTRLIAEEMGLPEAEVDRLQWAGLLHDIGKIAVPSDILNKPGALDEDERAIMRTHPIEGEAIVTPLKAWLGDAVLAVSQHHERWDGEGYPYGIRGTDISLAARIVSVADVFDVITAKRSYKEARSPAEARKELVRCAGSQFDPEVVRAFLSISVRKVWWIVGPIAWIGQVPAMASIQTVGNGVIQAGGSAAVAMTIATPGVVAGAPAPDHTAVDSWTRNIVATVQAGLGVDDTSAAASTSESDPERAAKASRERAKAQRSKATDGAVAGTTTSEPSGKGVAKTKAERDDHQGDDDATSSDDEVTVPIWGEADDEEAQGEDSDAPPSGSSKGKHAEAKASTIEAVAGGGDTEGSTGGGGRKTTGNR